MNFLLLWTWFHACLEKVPGSPDSVPGAMELVPLLSGIGSPFPGFISGLPGNLFHGCLMKVPDCLDLVPGSPGMVPQLPGPGSMAV